MSTARLAGLLLALGLLVTRISLVFHEVLGHALPARLFGAHIDAVHLLLFGGGYVRWSGAEFSPLQRIVVSTGGIAGELALGGVLLVAARLAPPSTLRFAAITAGALNVLHGAFYLAIGVHDGFGDGVPLFVALGARRGWVSWPAAATVVVGGFLFARHLARTLLDWVSPPRALLKVGAALAVAAGGHFALMQLELALRSETFFAERRAEAQQNRVDRAVEARQMAAAAAGRAPDADMLAQWRAEATADPPLPFQAFVLPALIVAIIIGASSGARATRRGQAPPTRGAVQAIWIALGVLVIAFGLTSP